MTASTPESYLAEWDQRLLDFEESQHISLFRQAIRNLLRNRLLLSGLVLAVLVVGAGILGPTIVGGDYEQINFSNSHATPFSEEALLGTDHLGRDTAIRLFVAIRVSLAVAMGVTVLALLAGLGIGTLAGFRGGWTDRSLSGLMDFIWGFPLILVAVLFAGGLGEGLLSVILAVGLVNMAAIARVVRGEVLSLSEREFIEAGPGGGTLQLEDHPKASPPQHPRPGFGARLLLRSGGHHRRGGSLLYRAGRPASTAQPGADGGGGP